MAERRKIVWTRRDSSRTTDDEDLAQAGLTPSTNVDLDGELPHVYAPLREALLARGTPTVDGSPQEEAIQLLQLAAELEHALMVQYLYAAISLARSATGGVGPWNTLMTIAEQEMGHLISVQNLLLAIGGPQAVHFGRDGIRLANPSNPMPFILEPVSRASLAKYLVVEMPAHIDGALDAEVRPFRELAAEQQTTPHGVGAVYAKLFWLFQPTDDPTPPLNLTPTPSIGLVGGRHLTAADFVDSTVRDRFGASRGDWIRGSVQHFLLDPVSDARTALDLISAISKQGEGLEQEAKSHFMEFLGLVRAFDSGQLIVESLPRTPVASIAPPPDAGSSTPIQTPYGKAWSELFDVRYNLLILDLWHAMASERTAPARMALIELAYGNMSLIKYLSRRLLELRAAPGSADAAPPFGFIDDGLPAEETKRWQKHAALLEDQAGVIKRIQASPEFADAAGDVLDFEGSLLIEDIASSDAARRQLIDTTLPHG
jgi:hypothetical protein